MAQIIKSGPGKTSLPLFLSTWKEAGKVAGWVGWSLDSYFWRNCLVDPGRFMPLPTLAKGNHFHTLSGQQLTLQHTLWKHTPFRIYTTCEWSAVSHSCRVLGKLVLLSFLVRRRIE